MNRIAKDKARFLLRVDISRERFHEYLHPECAKRFESSSRRFSEPGRRISSSSSSYLLVSSSYIESNRHIQCKGVNYCGTLVRSAMILPTRAQPLVRSILVRVSPRRSRKVPYTLMTRTWPKRAHFGVPLLVERMEIGHLLFFGRLQKRFRFARDERLRRLGYQSTRQRESAIRRERNTAR